MEHLHLQQFVAVQVLIIPYPNVQSKGELINLELIVNEGCVVEELIFFRLAEIDSRPCIKRFATCQRIQPCYASQG